MEGQDIGNTREKIESRGRNLLDSSFWILTSAFGFHPHFALFQTT